MENMQNQKTSEPLDKNLASVCTTVILICIMIVGAVFLDPNKSDADSVTLGNNNVVAQQPQQQIQQQNDIQPIVATEVSADDDAILGNKNAPVTIIEFSDFQCPFCRKFWKEALQQIKKEYIDTGKVKFVYRDFPLPFHPGAIPAAQAAECAKEQGKFWQMHDAIFEEQEKQGSGTIQFGAADLKTWAAKIGLSAAKFNQCLDSGKYQQEVEKDIADGSAVGVNGTPATFVNGVLVSGAQPFSVFKSAIEQALNNQ